MYRRIRTMSDRRKVLQEYSHLAHPILEAVKKGDIVAVDRLSKHLGPDDINQQDADGWTALHEAATRGEPEMVRSLLDAKAHPDVPSKVWV
jgi:ankyrin repeat protein